MAHAGRRWSAGLAVLLTVLLLVPAGAAQAAGRPIGSEYFGAQDDHQKNGSDAYGSARVWAAWCSIQPQASTSVTTAASRKLTRPFALTTAAKRNRVYVTLGHPAPWVFGNHKAASKRTNIWFCGANRSAVSFPTAASLRSGPVRTAYAGYVTAVISAAKPYLKASSTNRLVLQAWNEPNLASGGRVNTKIPGAARSWTQAAESLKEQERIMRAIATRLIPKQFEISSPALYGKTTKLGSAYLKAQSRSRTVDSFSVNFYTLHVKSPNSSIKQWRKKATRARRIVTRHKALRSVPIWITETNHSLVNNRKATNRKAIWTSAAAQKRLMEVSTLEALRQGFAGIQWYQGSLIQTAVNVRAGTPATVATHRLRDQLLGRRLLRCSTHKSVTTCVFSATTGSPAIRATWSSMGTGGVTLSR